MTTQAAPVTGTRRPDRRRDLAEDWVRRLLTPAEPLNRIAVLRVVIYLFVVWDTFMIVNDVQPHAEGPQNLYKPLLLRRLLHLPVPSPAYAHTLHAVIVIGALVAASGRLPRLSGTVVAAAFLDWVSIGMSYGKIDHDHFALVVATWALPTVGRARFSDRSRSEAAGWALLAIQLGVVATYFFSAWAKMRFGGWDWANGSVFAWAMVRRGTDLGRALLHPTWLLRAGQWGLLSLEALSPLLLLPRTRWRYAAVALFAGFHLVTYLTIKIHFLPVVVCLLAFLPLETWRPRSRFA